MSASARAILEAETQRRLQARADRRAKQLELAIEMRAAGHSRAEIAERTGMSLTAVRDLLRTVAA